MELIYTDKDHSPQGVLKCGFTLDMAYGEDENNFELKVPAGRRLQTGAYVYQYGTERGGVIDTEEYDSTGRVPSLVYKGRTWHGILANSVVRPNAGANYLVLSGDVSAVFQQLLDRQRLSGVFTASTTSGLALSNFQVPRYITLLETLERIAAHFGKRLDICKGNGRAVLSVAEVEYHTGGAGQNVPMTITNNARQTNHLILLGKGELADRLVRDVYADANGNVSTTQTLFGLDEIAETYEQSSVDDPVKLVNDGMDKLKDKQQPSEVTVYANAGEVYHIGDVVRGVAVDFGITAEAKAVKLVVSVDKNGNESVSCIVGDPLTTKTR